MTTLNFKKKDNLSTIPKINPILDDSYTELESFPKFKNSIEIDSKLISKSSVSSKIKTIKKFSIWGYILTILGNGILILTLTLLILKLFVFQQVEVDGSSMLPNFNDRDYLIMNSIDKNFERGQVVALYANDKFAYKATHELNPFDSYMARFDCGNPCNAKFYLKRIIGLPNEEIEVINGDVIIYNKQNPKGLILLEDYISQDTRDLMKKMNYHFDKTPIPAGKFFVMGDNRTNSTDSRIIGSISDYAIFGKQVLRVGNFIHNKGSLNNNSKQPDPSSQSFLNNLSDAFETYKWFDLPKYTFSQNSYEDKNFVTK